MQAFGDGIWTIEGDVVRMFRLVPYTTRMTVIRLRSGAVWLHSPVAPTEARLSAVETLGPVRYLVAPNRIHSLGVLPWQRAVPAAETWVSPAFMTRHPKMTAQGVLSDDVAPPWGDEIAHRVIAGHVFLDEVVFLHRASRTLIVTDVIQKHDPETETRFWRLVKRATGILGCEGGVARDLRLSFRDRAAARRSLESVLDWEFDNLILSHGICLHGGAKDEVARAFAWLLR